MNETGLDHRELIEELAALDPIEWPPDEAGDRIARAVTARWSSHDGDVLTGATGLAPASPLRGPSASGATDNRRLSRQRPSRRALGRRTSVLACATAACLVLILVLATAVLQQGPAKAARTHAVTRPPSTRIHAVPVHAVPVVYVGESPRLAVRKLPKGFRLATGKVTASILMEPVSKNLQEKQFVAGPADDPTSIVVAEGTDGDGPLPKVQGYAAANPGLTTETVIDSTTVTIIQVGFGDLASYVAFFPVSDTTWAIVGGSQGTTPDQLLTVVAGILEGTS